MTTDLLELYGRASEWTLGKVAGAAAQLDVATPCDDWAVRDLMSHMLETQQYFVASAQGHEAFAAVTDTHDRPRERSRRRFRTSSRRRVTNLRGAGSHRQDRFVAGHRVR